MKKIVSILVLSLILLGMAPAQISPHDFVFVEGGTFRMGSDVSAHTNEHPEHEVTVSSFYICTHEVTQAEYQAVMGKNPSQFKDDARPVECVTWYDAVEYCNKRSVIEGLTPCYTGNKGDGYTCDFGANGYRLPTEAEWEYAARGGLNSKGYIYSGSNSINKVAWYSKNKDDENGETHQVMSKLPNELGIYDMSGNVWEWCWDLYGFYRSGAQINPTGASYSPFRSLRGGAYDIIAKDCSVTVRENGAFPDLFHNSVGFRIARTTK